MKAKEITNVDLVENTSLNQELWKNTPRQAMKAREITNVIPVENPSLNQESWRHTSRQFMKDKVITNVNHVGNYFLNQDIWMIIKKVHENQFQKDNQCEFCEKLFSSITYLNNHIKAIHDGVKDQNWSLQQIIFYKT